MAVSWVRGRTQALSRSRALGPGERPLGLAAVSPLEALGIFAAGGAAGAINVVVGSGTLITFPTLLAFGYAPVVANVSNTIGLVPGSVAGAIGYRRELRGHGDAHGAGSPARRRSARRPGATLLLTLPASAFKSIVPVFIVLALVLIIAQPRLAALLRRHAARTSAGSARRRWSAVFATGVYGGYFGAAQGIMLLAILGLALDEELQRRQRRQERPRRPRQPDLGRDLRDGRPRRLAGGRR